MRPPKREVHYLNGRPFIWDESRNKNRNKIYRVRRFLKKRVCVKCGKEFFAVNKTTKLCSEQCSPHRAKARRTFKCINCGKERSVVESQFKFYPTSGKFCSIKCKWEYYSKYPEKHPNFKKNFKKAHGYLMYSRKLGYAHRTEIEKQLGRKLKEEEVVHHIDMQKNHNDLKNLYLYSSNPAHMQGHGTLNKLIRPLMEAGIISFKDGKYFCNK